MTDDVVHPALVPMLGDPVFVLLLAVHHLLDVVPGSDASVDHRIGGPTSSEVVLATGHRYRLSIERSSDLVAHGAPSPTWPCTCGHPASEHQEVWVGAGLQRAPDAFACRRDGCECVHYAEAF